MAGSHRRMLMKIGVLAAILVPSLSLPSPAFADQYPRQHGVEVEDYRFDIELSDDSDEIRVSETIDLSFSSANVRKVEFDLCNVLNAPVAADSIEPCQVPKPQRSNAATSAEMPVASDIGRGMTVTSVKAADRDLRFGHRNNRLSVFLPKPSRAGERLTIALAYHGTPAAGLFIGKNKYGDRVFFTNNWPNRARNWLAVIDHISVKSPKTISVIAPSHYQVISNGSLKSETDLSSGFRRTIWREALPIPTWQFSLGVAPMAVEHVGSRNEVGFSLWIAPQNKEMDTRKIAELNGSVFDFFSRKIGPYSYEKLAHIEAAGGQGGMELASSIFYYGNFDALTHEMAHQWFGNSVTEADWDHVWLSEGFATYFSLLYTEHAEGRDRFMQALRRTGDGALKYAINNPSHTIIHKNLDHDSRVLYNAPQIYSGGAMVLHTLRGVVGDSIFWEGIRLYYRRYANKAATTEDFRRAMEDACRPDPACGPEGLDLGWFFDQWLRRGGAPEVEARWRYDAVAKAVQISVSQNQSQGIYRLPVEVLIKTQPADTAEPGRGGKSPTEKRVRVVIDGKSSTFAIPVDAAPVDVKIDPDTWLPLLKSNFTQADESAR